MPTWSARDTTDTNGFSLAGPARPRNGSGAGALAGCCLPPPLDPRALCCRGGPTVIVTPPAPLAELLLLLPLPVRRITAPLLPGPAVPEERLPRELLPAPPPMLPTVAPASLPVSQSFPW